MECRLIHYPGAWEAQVSLRRGSRADTSLHEVGFGNFIRNATELEDRIRRAQVAILNPSSESTRFLSGQLPADSELRFSSDTVCIDVRGPSLTDLTFIDLPGTSHHILTWKQVIKLLEKLGLITNAGDEGEESDIQDVNDIVTSYLGGNTLILLTLTMRGELTYHAYA